MKRAMQDGLDWQGLLKLGLGNLQLKPDEFWALTPRELALMSGAENGSEFCLSRMGFDALYAQYPDEKAEE